MNYYEHHLGDWAAATGHLTWDEDMAYTRLLRAYYHAERPIPEGQQYRLAKAASPAQRRAVDAVLAEFFVLEDGAFHQKRADAEIARYQDKQRKAKASANARWSNAIAMRSHSDGSTSGDADALPPQSEGNAPNLQSPVSSLQSVRGANAPSTDKPPKAKRGSRKAPPDFTPDRDFALAELPDLDYEREAVKFMDFEFKTPHSDWPATWRTWIRTAKDRGQYSRARAEKAADPYAHFTRVT